jgi:hypothetical protein
LKCMKHCINSIQMCCLLKTCLWVSGVRHWLEKGAVWVLSASRDSQSQTMRTF